MREDLFPSIVENRLFSGFLFSLYCFVAFLSVCVSLSLCLSLCLFFFSFIYLFFFTPLNIQVPVERGCRGIALVTKPTVFIYRVA